MQLEARLARSGQTRPVIVHSITVRDSIDEAIQMAVLRGAKGNDALLEALAWREARMHAAPESSAADVEKDFEARLKELRKRMQQTHPDRGGDADEFIAARREYENLKEQADAN